jgi:pescadillo protein
VKDIAFLHHEPLLEMHRTIRVHERKIKKALAKKNIERAKRLREKSPKPKIDRIIRQRYPRFVDALGELDDCLTMVHLFATVPAIEDKKIDVVLGDNCRKLAHEWQAFIARTYKLRKTFVSVKGIYYQAEVEGQTITWLTPHALQQVVPDDVDIPTMLNFLQIYQPLLKFINHHLYHSINLKYPPILNPEMEALATELYALQRYAHANNKPTTLETSQLVESEQLESKQEGAEIENKKSELRLAQLQHQLPSNEPGALMHLVEKAAGEDGEEYDEETKQCKNLFQNVKIFLSREAPRESLLFVIPAFGGMVSWEGKNAPFAESDQSITHQIVDRDAQGHRFLSREYVQPQWVFDCVNARIILPTENYMVGRIPPPHLSPFVDYDEEGAYVPEYAKTIKHLQAAARKEVLPLPGVEKDLEDPQNLLVEGIIDRAAANQAAKEKQKLMILEKQYHEDLKKELQGDTYTSAGSTVKEETSTEVIQAGESMNNGQANVDDGSKLLISRKKRKLLEAMEISNKRKQSKNDAIIQRKKKLDEAQNQRS